MRIIIISDITESKETILPYGLNIGKHTDTRVEIIHFVDSRLVQGKYSSHSDSQSITPGEKLSHDAILQRETASIESRMNKLLSKEASRLNFPVRYNQIIRIDKLEGSLEEIIASYENSLVVTSTDPGHSMAAGLDDLLSEVINLDAFVLVVPVEMKFIKPEKALLVANFSEVDDHKTGQLFSWLNPLISSLFVTGHSTSYNADQCVKDMEAWRASAKVYAQNMLIEASEMFLGDNPLHILTEYIKHTNPDFIIYPKPAKSNSQELLPQHKIKEISEALNKPFLFI
jgi:hypothetical protein